MSENVTSLAQARSVVVEWMRAREADLRASHNGATDGALSDPGAITDQFLHWAKDAGFDSSVVHVTVSGRPAYEVHWTHRGSSFVGFKQPPPQDSTEDAFLLACAALLENEWCRQRLSSGDQ